MRLVRTTCCRLSDATEVLPRRPSAGNHGRKPQLPHFLETVTLYLHLKVPPVQLSVVSYTYDQFEWHLKYYTRDRARPNVEEGEDVEITGLEAEDKEREQI